MKPTTISTLSQFPKHGCSICGNEHIYDPRPIHVYYQRLLNAKDLEADKNGYERGRKEAIEAATKIVEDAIPMPLCGGKAARDKLMGFGVFLFRLRDSIKALAPSVGLSEAQKLLADSGGEKDLPSS